MYSLFNDIHIYICFILASSDIYRDKMHILILFLNAMYIELRQILQQPGAGIPWQLFQIIYGVISSKFGQH